jgi:hypothetical protein
MAEIQSEIYYDPHTTDQKIVHTIRTQDILKASALEIIAQVKDNVVKEVTNKIVETNGKELAYGVLGDVQTLSKRITEAVTTQLLDLIKVLTEFRLKFERGDICQCGREQHDWTAGQILKGGPTIYDDIHGHPFKAMDNLKFVELHNAKVKEWIDSRVRGERA